MSSLSSAAESEFPASGVLSSAAASANHETGVQEITEGVAAVTVAASNVPAQVATTKRGTPCKRCLMKGAACFQHTPRPAEGTTAAAAPAPASAPAASAVSAAERRAEDRRQLYDGYRTVGAMQMFFRGGWSSQYDGVERTEEETKKWKEEWMREEANELGWWTSLHEEMGWDVVYFSKEEREEELWFNGVRYAPSVLARWVCIRGGKELMDDGVARTEEETRRRRTELWAEEKEWREAELNRAIEYMFRDRSDDDRESGENSHDSYSDGDDESAYAAASDSAASDSAVAARPPPSVLTPFVVKELMSARTSRGESTDCPVCWNDLTELPIYGSACGHLVCQGCYEQLDFPRKCPTCRDTI